MVACANINSLSDNIISVVGRSSYCTFDSIYVTGGQYGIYLVAQQVPNAVRNHIVRNSTFRRQLQYGVYLGRQQYTTVYGNYIYDMRNPTASNGIYAITCENTIVSNNRIEAINSGINLNAMNSVNGFRTTGEQQYG